MPYGLIVDGALREMGDVKYLLSPQDLMAVEHLPQLIRVRALQNVLYTLRIGRVPAVRARDCRFSSGHISFKAVHCSQAGVSCLKIEGRLKGPEYVALTTRVYREAVDKAWQQINDDAAVRADTLALSMLDQQTRTQLQQVFARGQDVDFEGLTPGFLDGPRHQRLVRGKNPRHRGVCVGRCGSAFVSRLVLGSSRSPAL